VNFVELCNHNFKISGKEGAWVTPRNYVNRKKLKKNVALENFKRKASKTTVYNACCQSAWMGTVIQQNNFK
jgi:hypothetical protein